MPAPPTGESGGSAPQGWGADGHGDRRRQETPRGSEAGAAPRARGADAPAQAPTAAPGRPAPAAEGAVPAAPAAAATPGAAAGAEAAGAGPLLDTGVGMQEMIDSIRASIELASRQGIAQARIALQPESLGEVRIHLTQTRDGLIARVSAQTPEAVRALMAGHGELAQSLRSLGTSLLGLDIGAFGRQQAHPQHAPAQSAGRGGASATPAGEAEALDQEPEQPSRAGSASRGTLVDVLV